MQEPLMLERVIREAKFIFLCVPSKAVRSAAISILPYLLSKAIVIVLAKGIEVESELFMDEVLIKTLPSGQPFALLGGPMLAAELATDMSTTGVVGSRDEHCLRALRELFLETTLHLETNLDLRGVALAGTLKNIYAMVLGIAHALAWGENQKGWLVAQSIFEMAFITKQMGGLPQTVYGVAGLGDLVATGFSPYSRNRKVGISHVEDQTPLRGESTNALPIIISKIGLSIDSLPLLRALRDVVMEKSSPRAVFESAIKMI